jgi:superfamily II DNA/RNA helicase
MVFARDTAAADAVAAALAEGGVGHVVYHKGVAAEARDAALAAMGAPPAAAGAPGAVMVCTDAAARGIDIPGVTHVIQADFASTAVDFLHRIGRTARAGRGGRVTSLVRPENAALADVLRRYIEEGRPVEDVFSRNRSFSRKMKRYDGEFIPRGQTQEGAAAAAAGGGGGVAAAAAVAAQ